MKARVGGRLCCPPTCVSSGRAAQSLRHAAGALPFLPTDPDVSSEESASTVEERGNETPPATSSEAEPPKEPEAGEKAAEKPAEEAPKE